MGRYITSDPIGIEGGLNTFVYTSNNPLRWIDPDGLEATAPTAPGVRPVGPFEIPWWAYPSATTATILGGIGASLYSPEACPAEGEEIDCVEEWRAAYETCAKEMKRGGHRGITGGYKDEYDCARGLVSQRCGGNSVD